ncbi:hypothetical protein GOY17_13325 [Lysobacter soli]|uniref:ESPR-type extended signal peptide-containing protein n=1 Tax=Lysobacter soli TaxID=453783 RepID=UPI0012EE7B50|nr:ESPR-type extended signal peptide-containing protein [Lysobacter soli]QGW65803.1 hypothetical protein GOY17_13325 [Lysobacter soli]
MNKIFRIVFNAATGRYVVASEMAKGRTKASAAGAVLTAVVALAAVGNAQAKVVINAGTNESAIGCTYLQDENSPTLHTSSASGTCLVAAGTGESGQGDPGKRAVFYASDTVNGNEDSLNLGGYLDAWKLASFHGGLEMNSTKITGLAAGNVASGSADAINGDQLFDSNTAIAAAFGSPLDASGNVTAPSYALANANTIGGSSGAATDVGTAFGKVDAALGALDTRVTSNANDISSLQTTVNNISSGTVGLVQQSAAGQKLTVGKDTDGAAVDFTGTAGTRKLQGVSEGEVSATSKEAINGSQLYTTNQNVAQNTSDIDALKGRADATDAAVAQNTTDIAKNTTDIAKNAGDIAKNTTDIAKNTSDIAKNTTDIAKNTSDIADLQTRADATEASVAQNTSDIAKNTSDIAKNTSDIAALDDRTTKNEGDISNLDNRVTNVEGDVSNLSQQISNGEVGLVKQDATSKVITVAADKDGTEVNIAGTQGERKLGGVADGEVSATSKQAVNGSQLNATNERVAANESAIAGVDARTTKNEGDIANLDQRQTKTEGDVATLDQRQTKTEGDVTNLRSDVTTIDGRVTNVESNVATLNQRMVQGNTEVLEQSRSYTDSRFDALHGEMDDRFNVQDQRIDSMGAMNSAMSMMSASLAGLHTQDRAAVGTGVVNGEVALSVGYQHAISDSANFTLGGAFTQDDQSVGAAVGFGW